MAVTSADLRRAQPRRACSAGTSEPRSTPSCGRWRRPWRRPSAVTRRAGRSPPSRCSRCASAGRRCAGATCARRSSRLLDEVVHALRTQPRRRPTTSRPPGRLAAELREVRLPAAPQGYARDHVHRLLAGAVEALEAAEAVRPRTGLSAQAVLATRLPRDTGEGYDPAAVDHLVHRVVLVLAEHERPAAG